MADKEDIYNQTTEALENNDKSSLEDLERRLQVLENRIGRTTRELKGSAVAQNISKELEDIANAIEALKANKIPEEIKKTLDEIKEDREPKSLSADLRRRCIYCGNGVYRKVANGRNLTTHEAIEKIGEWGVPWVPNKSFKEWIILVCNRCSNVQYFAQPDPDLWEK